MLREEYPTKHNIRLSAYRLMLEQGIKAASYTEIAKQSGVGRPLVQKHFSKKEQLILDVIEDIIIASVIVLKKNDRFEDTYQANILRAPQIYLTVLLGSEASIRFTSEAMRMNGVAMQIVDVLKQMAASLGLDTDDPGFMAALLKAVGGLEKMAYYQLEFEQLPPAKEFAVDQAASFSVFYENADYHAALDEYRAWLLNDAEATALAKEALTMVLR